MTVALALVLLPLAVTVRVATYEPLLAYACCGLAEVLVEPSPKFQEYERVLVFPNASVEPFDENCTGTLATAPEFGVADAAAIGANGPVAEIFCTFDSKMLVK
jgi:hypothetical protein